MSYWRSIFAVLLLFVPAFSSDAKRWISADMVIPLRETPQLETKTFENPEQLLQEIQEIKQHSFDVSDMTTQQISSQFAQVLLEKLPDSKFKTKMQTESRAYKKRRWDDTSQQLFEKVLHRYFKQVDKEENPLEIILSVAKELGQINRDGSKTKTNAFKAQYVKELEKSFAAESQERLLPDTDNRLENLEWIQKTFNKNQASIEVYHMSDQFFGVPKKKSLLTKETNLKGAEASFDMSGSLNTYVDHGEVFDPLGHLKSWANDIVKEDDELSIAQRIYLIWKTPGYTTMDHQDVHQKQHVVSYHQMKGEAVFHILPPICGLYVAHLYVNQDLGELENTLAFFDRHKIGSYTHLKQGEIIFLPPDKTHFVQVPYSKTEQVGYVRAYEVLFDYVKMEERQMLLESELSNFDHGNDSEDSDYEAMSKTNNTDSDDEKSVSQRKHLGMPAKERTFGETHILVHTTGAGHVIRKLYVQEKHLCSFQSEKAAEDALEILRPIRKKLSSKEALNLIDKILDHEVQHRLTEDPDLYRKKCVCASGSTMLRFIRDGILIEMVFESERNFINVRREILKYVVQNAGLRVNKNTGLDRRHVDQLRNIIRRYKLVDKKEDLEKNSNQKICVKIKSKDWIVRKGNSYFGSFQDKEHAKKVRDELELDVVQAWPDQVDLEKLSKTDKYEEFRKKEELRDYHMKLENLKNPENDSYINKGKDKNTYIVRMRIPPGKPVHYRTCQTREKAKKVAVRVLELYTKSLEDRIRRREFAEEPIQKEEIKEILKTEFKENSQCHKNKRKREEDSDYSN